MVHPGGAGGCGDHRRDASESQMRGGGEAEFEGVEVGAVCRSEREKVDFRLKCSGCQICVTIFLGWSFRLFKKLYI